MSTSYIWTHFCDDPDMEHPWTALRLDDVDENPYETLAEYGHLSGAEHGKTEFEAIAKLNKFCMKDPIIEAVREKFLARSKVGIKKYGIGLDRTDLTTLEWLQHAQEEAMDHAAYLEVLIQKEMLNKE